MDRNSDDSLTGSAMKTFEVCIDSFVTLRETILGLRNYSRCLEVKSSEYESIHGKDNNPYREMREELYKIFPSLNNEKFLSDR